jgi:hypothetical protein
MKRLVDTANLERARAAGVELLGYLSARREQAFRDAVGFLTPLVDMTTAAMLREALRDHVGNRTYMIRLLQGVVTELNQARAGGGGGVDPVREPARDPAAVGERPAAPSGEGADGCSGRKDPRGLRNCYLTEDNEEIAAAVTQPVRRLGIVVQGGRSRP